MYADETGDGRQDSEGMKSGVNISDFEKNFRFDVESVFIKKGCRLEVDTGPYN